MTYFCLGFTNYLKTYLMFLIDLMYYTVRYRCCRRLTLGFPGWIGIVWTLHDSKVCFKFGTIIVLLTLW